MIAIAVSERWMSVKSFEKLYEVSNLGRVRSLDRVTSHWLGGQRLQRGKVLRPRIVKGYCHVTLQDKPRIVQISVHRLVAEAFITNPDAKPFVNHRDGNKRHNETTNLEWATVSENNAHAFATGLRSSKGERCTSSVLRQADVIEIRERIARGETCAAISKDYPVSDRAISRIKRRVVWSHI